VDFGAALQVAVAVGVIEVLYCEPFGASVVIKTGVCFLAVRLEPDIFTLLYVFQFHNVFLSLSGPPCGGPGWLDQFFYGALGDPIPHLLAFVSGGSYELTSYIPNEHFTFGSDLEEGSK
jgi:hypothetical protein